uniref:Two pore segment channel 3 n=1 Tax=Scleropages formosus TaxID=113540 RepID=A0A8C9SMN8_SCLFO
PFFSVGVQNTHHVFPGCGVSSSEMNPSELKLAAVYVSDAQYNRNVFFNTSPQCVRLYMLYNHWSLQFLVYVFIFVDLALALFEDPAFVPLPLWATYIMELICLAAFTARLIHYARIIPKQKFWKDPKNICIVVVILLTLVDMIIYGSLKAMDYHVVRWSRVFRPLFLVNVTEGRHLRRAFRSIRNALPQIIYVFFLFIISVLMFSLMALKLFGKRDLKTIDGRSYFTNYGEIIFDLYVLVTTANSPDVMMPAYNSSSTFSIFFIVYILINTYTFMSVFLAVVYNNYKKYLKEEVRQLVRAKRQKMVRAFKVLQEMRDEEPVVMQACWNQLVCVVQPNITNAHRELLWSVSDENKRGKMAFLQLPDLLNIQVITLKSRTHPLEIWIPRIYSSSASRLICRVVQHRAFVYIYDFIILVNAVFIGLDEENSFFSYAEWVFLGLYLLEILMKLYTFEPRAFYARHQFWNCGWVAKDFKMFFFFFFLKGDGYNGRQILDIVFILRVLRLLRVVDSIKRFRAIINTLVKIGPTILTFGQLILVVYYIFAMVGMELFKGKITYFENSASPGSEYCGNPLLKGSAFAKNNYCKNNFNNVWSSFVLLVELTVVNQWHDILFLTNASARIFFVIFHILVVIIIINIFVAFVLEAFFVEYTFSKGELQTSLEKKIEELELGYRTVDGLLQRMFEADLSPEDNADDEDPDNESPPGYNFPNPSYDTI